MADTPAPDQSALTARLVTGRLTAPGIIDRAAVQRTVDRLSRPASAHAIERLHRRAAPTNPGSDPLVLARVDRGEDASATPLPGAGTNAPAPSAHAPSAAAATIAPAAPVARMLARQSLGAGHAAERVAARLTRPPGASGGAPLVARLAARASGTAASSPIATAGVASSPVLQRSAAMPAAPRADAVGIMARPVSAGAARVDAPIASPSPRVQRSAEPPASTVSAAASVAPTQRVVTPELVVPAAPASGAIAASMPLLQRAPLAAPHGHGAARPIASRSPLSATGPSAPLLLRNPERSSAAQSRASAPSIATRTSGVVARTEAAPLPAAAPKPESDGAAYAWADGNALDMDWIVEQVGSRLARRLEVERERQGIREWRQPS